MRGFVLSAGSRLRRPRRYLVGGGLLSPFVTAALLVVLAGCACGRAIVVSAAPCDGVTCSGHGTCIVSGRPAIATCECDTQYHASALACVPDEITLTETITSLVLENSWMQVHIARDSGLISAVEMQGESHLQAPTGLRIRDKISGQEFDVALGTVTHVRTENDPGASVGAVFDIEVRDDATKDTYRCSVRYVLTAQALLWDVVVASDLTPDREMNIDFVFPILATFDKAFWTRAGAPFDIARLSPQNLIYAAGAMVLPLVSFYSSVRDAGFSFVGPLDRHKPRLSFKFNQAGDGGSSLVVGNEHLRCGVATDARAGVFLVPHAGDWRPGLDWVSRQYPEYFESVAPRVTGGEGHFCYGGPYSNSTPDKMQVCAENGVTWDEFHFHFPFYGLYAPLDRNDWASVWDQDSSWSLSEWEADTAVGRGRTGYANNQAQMSAWHDVGVQSYVYFQAFEAWHQYSERYFAGDIARDQNGDAYPAWVSCTLMNPDPGSLWGQHLLGQLDKMLDMYPEMDGIFLDRPDHNRFDYAHSDGVSMITDRPVYKLGFALEEIDDLLFSALHDRGKGVWANGPTSVEVTKGVDGVVSEFVVGAPFLQYLAVRRPFVLLAFDKLPRDAEEKLKMALRTSGFPMWTLGGAECQRLESKYRPLFAHFPGRHWVLSPHVVATPPDVEGNVFETPSGDYLVTLVAPARSQLEAYAFRHDNPVVVNIADIEEIAGCYLLSGDYRGVNVLDCNISDGAGRLDIPVHLVSSMAVLTKGAGYEVSRRSSPLLIRGETSVMTFVLRNTGAVSKDYDVSVVTPWSTAHDSFTLQPEETRDVSLQATIPLSFDAGDTGEVDLQVSQGVGVTTTFSAWVTDFFQFEAPTSVFIRPTHNQDVSVSVVNHVSRALAPDLSAAFASGSGTVAIAPTLTLDPLGVAELSVRIAPSADQGDVRISGIAEGRVVEGVIHVNRALVPAAGDLFHDDFSSGSMSQWSEQGGTWSVAGGEAKGSGPAHLAITPPGRSAGWTNYRFQANTRIEGSATPGVDWLKSYLFVRVQDLTHFYRFGIHGDAGVIDLYRFSAGTWTLLKTGAFSPERGRWYTLAIEVNGDSLKGYVDGAPIIDAHDATFATGGVGIGVREDSMMPYYDDVVVQAMP